MRLHELTSNTKPKRKKRLGCGNASGRGKTCGKGHKGQKSRTGASTPFGFEGGQMPLARRLPKKGFNNNAFKKFYAIVNISELNIFEDGSTINEELLREKNIVKGRYNAGVKILGKGKLTKKLNIENCAISESAKKSILELGGEIS